ncbi:MAG TPA: UDP-N-acetylglucosamine pyrophosphorylase [Planctomycetota bacterium]|nr:UDP-N-acetylglucosamine pyrophosphorylase [Planctomycetota bacterium]
MTESVLAALARRGVVFPAPELVFAAPDVDPSRFEAGAVVHPGARLYGPRTAVGRGAQIGSAGPISVRNCAIGRDVDLASGTFEDAVFLDGAAFGPSGHARAGTLFEECARAAHSVGVKQTVLLPFAVLGSLINFCDCLLAGGTGADDHSEVGSGFIHFNFSPSGERGDKATPSLFGDATRGVFLRSRRIFLGGGAGVVGPLKVGYGAVLAAGSVYRKDRGEGVLAYAERLPDRERPFDAVVFRNAREKVRKNLEYLAQLAALRAFYVEARRPLAAGDAFAEDLVRAAVRLLDGAAEERVRHLERLASDLRRSAARLSADGGDPGAAEIAFQARFAESFAAAKPALMRIDLAAERALGARDALTRRVGDARCGCTAWVRGLSNSDVAEGIARLEAVAAAYLGDPAGARRLL